MSDNRVAKERRRPWWALSAREARGHALVVAAVLWIAAAVIGFAGRGDRGIAGPLKWADFVHFYTLGHLAATGRGSDLYDYIAVHEAQGELVPAAADEIYPAVYPPQAALLFAPLTRLPYRTAALLWVLITVAIYWAIVRSAWKMVRDALPDGMLVVAAALAFPPFWFVVLHGQVTILILVSFYLGTLALTRERPFLAGLAFGLLALKPQFGVPLAAIVIGRGEWRLLAGALTSVLMQVSLVSFTLGGLVIVDFVRSIPDTIRHTDLLESRPFMSHSLRSLTRLLPSWAGVPVWLLSVATVLWYTVRAWRPQVPVLVRMSIVILASVLVNPHLIVYDAAILALPLLWLATRVNEHTAREYGMAVYALFALLLAPTAAIVGLQASVLVIVWIFLSAATVVSKVGALANILARARLFVRQEADHGARFSGPGR